MEWYWLALLPGLFASLGLLAFEGADWLIEKLTRGRPKPPPQ